MRSIFCFFLCIVLNWSATAQSSRQLDSLKRVLATLPPEGSSYQSDTTRVRVMCEMANEMPFSQIDSTIRLLDKPLAISKKIRWQLGESMSNYYIGYFYVGKNHLMKGIDYLFQSLSISEQNNILIYVAQSNKTLGDAYAILGNYEKAKKHLTKSIELFKQMRNKREELLAVNNLGLMYYEKKDYKASIPCFEYCLSENKIHKIKNLDDIFLSNLGSSLRFLGDYNKALRVLQHTENILRGTSYQYRRILNFTSIADLWLLKNETQQAKAYLDSVQVLQKKYGTRISQKEIYEIYYKIYKKENDSKKGLYYYEQFIDLEKAMTKQDQVQRINNLQASFDNERKTTEIKLLNQTIKQESLLKNIFIGGAVLLLLFSVLFWRNSQKLSKQNKIIEEQRLELQSTNNQLETLNHGLEQKVQERTSELQQANKSLIKKNEEIILAMVEGQTIERKRVASELHDNLGATLSAIKWRLEAINGQNLTDKERKIYESTLEMMKGAYAEVRLISHNLLPAELEKGGLKQALEKFIVDINSSGKLNISHNLQPQAIPVDKKTQFELYGIALELINNILKHAQAQHAHVALYIKGGQTIFEVSDDGRGFYSRQNGNGMGSKTIQNRVDALNGSIKFLPQEIGTNVKLYFSTHHI